MEMESHPLWPIYNPLEDSTLDEIGLYFAEMDTQLSSFDQFSNSSVSIEDFSDISSSTLHPFLGNHFPGILPSLGCGESPSSDQFMLDGSENFPELITYERSNSSQQIFSEDFSISSSSQNLSPISGEVSVEIPSIQAPLVLPSENMEVDEQLVIPHLLKAYGEAMESQQIELADEIVSCLKDKASPTGKTLERLLFYLTFALDKQGNYLRQESIKNYEAAFEAFYQIFPYSRFAHFGANSAILEAIPIDAKVVHIVDFQIGRGIQWPPLIESLARKGIRMLSLTSLKWEEEYDNNCNVTIFEETKKQLCNYAMNFGLKLEVKEMDMEGLVKEIEMARERFGKTEFLAFNFMAGLPQMGKGFSLKHVEYFLKTAEALISNSRGIITFGNGIDVEKWMECTNFSSFFEGQMVYFQALLESMEQFQLLEARIAMECLFVLPYISSLTNNAQEWEESTRKSDFLSELGLAPRRMSRENYEEAKELVREGKSSYWVRIQGEACNQMVLGYMGTPLVRVSSWR